MNAAIELAIVNAIFSYTELLLKSKSGQTVTQDDVKAQQLKTQAAMDAAHAQVEADKAG